MQRIWLLAGCGNFHGSTNFSAIGFREGFNTVFERSGLAVGMSAIAMSPPPVNGASVGRCHAV